MLGSKSRLSKIVWLQTSNGSHLWADVEEAVDGQNRVGSVLNRLGKEPVAAALQEPFQQEVWRCIQEGLLAVRGTHILGGADRSKVFHFLDRRACLQVQLVFVFLLLSYAEHKGRPRFNGRSSPLILVSPGSLCFPQLELVSSSG